MTAKPPNLVRLRLIILPFPDAERRPQPLLRFPFKTVGTMARTVARAGIRYHERSSSPFHSSEVLPAVHVSCPSRGLSNFAHDRKPLGAGSDGVQFGGGPDHGLVSPGSHRRLITYQALLSINGMMMPRRRPTTHWEPGNTIPACG